MSAAVIDLPTGRNVKMPGIDKNVENNIIALRALIERVQLVNNADLAKRWGLSREGVRSFLLHPDAPKPVFKGSSRAVFSALPEVEAFRTRQLRQRRGGRA